MIIVVDALNKHKYAELLDEMFKLRARVFEGRLGWQVTVKDGRERDDFDNLDPAYVIGVDDDGHVVSCVRALQTTGPHMLSDVFSAILHGEPPLRSATIWESTRFCVDTKRLGRGRGPNSVSYATCELMIGSLEFCQQSGITDIVTVIDPVMDRVLKRSDNAPYGYVGRQTDMGKVPALAALLDCSDERIARVRNFAGIHHDVFAAEPVAAEAATAPAQAISEEASVLRDYVEEQIRSATTRKEKAAALALRQALSEKFHSTRKCGA